MRIFNIFSTLKVYQANAICTHALKYLNHTSCIKYNQLELTKKRE